jgi:hypothetical protein
MGRYLFVVTRDHVSLRDYLAAEFAQEPEVHVILDRREQERRRGEEGLATPERRSGERRRARAGALGPSGFAFVRVE